MTRVPPKLFSNRWNARFLFFVVLTECALPGRAHGPRDASESSELLHGTIKTGEIKGTA